MYAYVSGWNKSNDGSGTFGITVYRVDEEKGSLEEIERVCPDNIFNVTYYDNKRHMLYALEEVGENKDFRSGGGGRIFVFKADPAAGTLREVDCRATWSPSPCYLGIDDTGRYLMVTHHGSYNAATKIEQDENGKFYPVIVYDDMPIELFALDEEGHIGELLDIVKCTGDGPEKRQVHAHPHTVVKSPSGALYAVCDKGSDTVSMYGIDIPESGKASIKKPEHVYKHKPGTCPRYCVFHPYNKWFYHNDEADGLIHFFNYGEDGTLEMVESVSALIGQGESKEKGLEQQGFVIDGEGKFIYSVVRGPGVVAVMKVDSESGKLKAIQNRSIDGLWPRGCALTPDGRYLFICCRDSGDIISINVNEDGTLGGKEQHFANPNAAYITFSC